MNKNIKQITAITLLLALVVGCFATLPLSSATTPIYLKGSGSNFDKTGWKNIFYLGGADKAENPSVWHLVYTGNDPNAITEMQITFTNGEVFKWTPSMKFSTNNGGNNPGWVIVAPYDYVIDYVNKGNNNESPSFLSTDESGNINFNISGFHQGSPDEGPDCGITLRKTVNGIEFGYWLEGFQGDVKELLSDITFALYRVQSKETPIDDRGRVRQNDVPVDGILDSSGFITFEFDFATDVNTRRGVGGDNSNWYAVTENLGTEAAKIFKVNDDPLYFAINTRGNVVDPRFDYEALYTIVNGYNSDNFGILNYPGLNNGGDFFYIGVVNTKNSERFDSYCANAGSKNFAGDNNLGCSGYYSAVSANDYDWLCAFNYIQDKIGDLNENRKITQTVIWAILGAVDVDSTAFDATNLLGTEKIAVRDVMANYKDYKGAGKIADAVYMVCENVDHTFEFCQPQIVPIKAYVPEIDNKAKDPTGSLTVSVNVEETYTETTYQPWYQKTFQPVYQRIVTPLWQKTFQPMWQKVYQPYEVPTFVKDISSSKEGTLVTRLTYTDNTAKAVPKAEFGGVFKNGHTYVVVDVNEASAPGGINFAIADSSSNSNGKKTPDEYNKPIGYEYNVKITKDGELIVSCDDRLISASVGAYVANTRVEDKKNPDAFPGNAPSHYKNTVTINMPKTTDNGKVYLYVHFEGGISWYTTGKYEFAGWVAAPDHTKLVSDSLVRNDLVKDEQVGEKVVEFFVRKNLVSKDFVENKLVSSEEMTVPVEMGLRTYNLIITKAGTTEIAHEGTISNGVPVIVDNLAPGEYNCILTDDLGNELETLPITVVANENTTDAFKTISETGTDTEVYLKKKYLDDVNLDKIYRDDIVLPKVYLKPLFEAKQYLGDDSLPVIRLGSEDPEDAVSIEYGKYTPERPQQQVHIYQNQTAVAVFPFYFFY